MTFTPELGQVAWGNTPWSTHKMQSHVEESLCLLASFIMEVRGETFGSLISNSGAEPWESDVFSLRAYCWCEGDTPGHEDGCPVNFEHHPSGFTATWYKHVGRGASTNRLISVREWVNILGSCIRDVASS